MTVKQLNVQIAKLKRQIALISLQADSCTQPSDTITESTRLRDFADELIGLTYGAKNTIQKISELFQSAHNQLTDAEKHALWSLLFEYCRLIDKNITYLQHHLKDDFTIEEMLHATKQNLEAIRDLIQPMEFKTIHLYPHGPSTVDVSSQQFNRAALKERMVKPGFISKLITKICVKAITDVAEKEIDIADNLKSTLLSAPNDVISYPLRIDQKTNVQAVEYRNPVATDKWLIVVGGAGASYTNMLPVTKEVATRNHYNFLVVDYLAEGATSFASPVKIILAAAAFLYKNKGVKPENLVLMGHSNGGRIVLEAATALPGCSVITNNTYTSLEEVIVKNVLHAIELFKNMGIPVNKYAEEIINSIADFIKAHHLDEKILHRVRKALETTNNGYQSEHVKAKIPDHRYAAVYTAPSTTHDSDGQKLPKTGGDKLLFEASDGMVQAQRSKQSTPEQRELLKKRNRFFTFDTEESAQKAEVLGVKYKDSPNPARHGHHLVLKGITNPRVKNTHNVIDAGLLSTALAELEKQKDYKPLTLQEQLQCVLDKYYLNSELEHLLEPVGIELAPTERFLLIKIMTQLKKDPNQAGMPTQEQLMRLFQASSAAAEIISAYEPALNIMTWGDNLAEYKKGRAFLEERLRSLGERSMAPNPCLQGTGAYLNKNLADVIMKRLRNYHAQLPGYEPGLFSGSTLTPVQRHRLFQGTTISDLDLSHVTSSVMVCA